MAFYALRVVCQNCGSVSVVGGCAEYDLSSWRDADVACRLCGAETSASNAEAVALSALSHWEAPGKGTAGQHARA